MFNVEWFILQLDRRFNSSARPNLIQIQVINDFEVSRKHILIQKFTSLVNYWLRGSSTVDSVNKDYVLGGNLETITDNDGAYKVVMKLQVKVQKLSDFGIYKCVAKNALGNAEEIVRILRKFIFIFNPNWKLTILHVTLNENKSYKFSC